tara:strand:+ start:209 stop:826 length:618 start_codon:yes stop_codon:yes gene_type:complete
MTLQVINKAFKKSAKKIKRNLVNLKEASKKAGMEKSYGVNGPLGQLAIDAVFPGSSNDIFEELMSKDARAVRVRETYKFTLGKQLNTNETLSTRMDTMDRFLGTTDSEETFSKIAKAAKDFKGKGDHIEGIINLAQNKEELKDRIEKNSKEEMAPKIKKDIAESLSSSPLSEDISGKVNTISNLNTPGLEQAAQDKFNSTKKELV